MGLKLDGANGSALSVPRAFLERNGKDLLAIVERDEIHRLEGALLHNRLQEAGYKLPSYGAADSSYVSRLSALVRAYRALICPDFSALLWAWLSAARCFHNMSYEDVARAAGMPLIKLKNSLMHHGGVTGMTPAEALQLDKVLRADLELFSAFTALTQHTIYKTVAPVIDQVLERRPFHAQLQAAREAAGHSRKEVASMLAIEGLKLAPSQLWAWERGRCLPSLPNRKLIEALDKIYSANGSLVAAWELENPKTVYTPYAWRSEGWSNDLQAQFTRYANYKTTNPEELDLSPAPGGDRWTGSATEAMVKEALERMFGFFRTEKRFGDRALSLTLLADWDLVYGHFEFVRTRTGQPTYSQDVVSTTRFLINLLVFFLPHLADTAAREAYWNDRLPTFAVAMEETVPGVFEWRRRELLTFEERWQYQLFLTANKAREFLSNTDQFRSERLAHKALPLIDAKTDMMVLLQLLEKRCWDLPERICCRDAAIFARQLTEAILLVALNFRPETLISLRYDQAIVGQDFRVWLRVAENQFKNRGKGGSKNGFYGQLPAHDFMHKVVRRYKLEARPILLGDPATRGNVDAGYLLTPSCSAERAAQTSNLTPGGPLSGQLLGLDIQAILGYNPYAQRHVFASAANRQNESTENIAKALKNTVKMVEGVYVFDTPEIRMKQATTTMGILLFE